MKWEAVVTFSSPSVKSFTFPVKGGLTMELAVAQFWSSGIGSHEATHVDFEVNQLAIFLLLCCMLLKGKMLFRWTKSLPKKYCWLWSLTDLMCKIRVHGSHSSGVWGRHHLWHFFRWDSGYKVAATYRKHHFKMIVYFNLILSML